MFWYNFCLTVINATNHKNSNLIFLKQCFALIDVFIFLFLYHNVYDALYINMVGLKKGKAENWVWMK